MEKRFNNQVEITIRGKPEEEKVIEGYVVEFDKRSDLLYEEFYEKVLSGAFLKSLKRNTVKALWNHDTNLVLGSTKAKTLDLKEDERGLKFSLKLPDTEQGRSVYESIRRR